MRQAVGWILNIAAIWCWVRIMVIAARRRQPPPSNELADYQREYRRQKSLARVPILFILGVGLWVLGRYVMNG